MLDTRTILLSLTSINIVCAIVIAVLWFQNRKRYAGIGYWLANFVLQFVALLLFGLRGNLPDLVSVVLGNSLVISGLLLLYIGLERFVEKPGFQIHNYIFLAAFVFLHAYFTFVQPSLQARNINVTIAFLIIFFQIAWLIFRRLGKEMSAVMRNLGLIAIAYCLASLTRIIVNLVIDPGSDFFNATPFDALVFLIYQALLVAGTFSLLLAVNRRLFVDLENDNAERLQTRETLQVSEKRYHPLYENMLDGYAYCKMIYEDGQPKNFIFLNVNEAFKKLTGFRNVEGKKVTEVIPGIRIFKPDLFSIFGRVAQTGKMERFETYIPFLRLWFSVSVDSPEPEHFVAVVENITERKQSEGELRESEALYHQMFHNHSAIMMLIDPETGHIVEANLAAANFYGYPLNDLQNMTIRQINVLDPNEIAKRRQEVKNKEQTYFIFPHRLASGEIREVEVYSIPVEIEGRSLLYSIIHDVTERKRMDDAVRYRNELLAALQRVMLELVNRHEVDDILKALLVEISKLLDAPNVSVDLIENNDTLITYAATPDQPLQVEDRMRRGEGGWLSWQAVETGQPAILDDYSNWEQRRSLYEGYSIHAIMIVPIKHRDSVVGAINILRNEPDKPFGETDVYVAQQLAQIVALVLDNANLYAQLQAELIERRQAEQALRKSEYSLTRAQSVSRTGHYEWDLETDTITWSLEIYHILGLDPDSYTPTTENFIKFVHLDDVSALSRENMERLICFKSHEMEFRIIDQISKQEKFVYLWGETTFDLNGEPKQVLGILQDISDRKYNEEAAITLSAFEERQRLARNLHDLVSQSLHSLVLFAETVSYNFEQNQLDRLEYLIGRMSVSARQAYKEMRLMLYELQAPWEKTHLSLQEALQARLRAVESRAQIDAKLIVEGFPQWPQEWEGELFWTATEALNNALKHSRANQVRIHLRNDDGLTVLEVIDDGIGFDPATVRPGGMGLDNMAARAAKIGGILAVVSAPGEGTCIRLEARKEVS